MAVNEFLLLKRFSASGDAEAFAEIAREHAPLVYGVCLRILEDRDTAADVVQDTFLQLARNADTITGSLPNWLHRVAKNRAIKLIRQNSSRKQREKIYAADSEIESQEEAVFWQEISACIDEELDQFDDLTREVLILHFFEGQTMTCIAEKFGISQPTVSRRIESGIDSLRQKLKSRGIIVTATILTALLAKNIVKAAPASIMKELGKIALSGSKAATNIQISSRLSVAKAKIIALSTAALFIIGSVILYINFTLATERKTIAVNSVLKLSAQEILQKYTESQDKFKSFILKYDCEYTATNKLPFLGNRGEEIHNGKGGYIGEFRSDGKRNLFLRKTWGNGRSDLPKTKDMIEHEPRYVCEVWNGKNRYQYMRSNAEPSSDLVFLVRGSDYNPDEDSLGKRNYVTKLWGVAENGYTAIAKMRIDQELKNAKTISVQPQMEKINGTQCYIINAITKDSKYKIWIDPLHEYNIVQATITRGGEGTNFGKPEEISLTAYIKNVRFEKNGGAWIPVEGDYGFNRKTIQNGFEIEDYHLKITSFELNPDHEALGSFEPNFIRNGSRVQIIGVGGIIYTWQDGKVVDSYGYEENLSDSNSLSLISKTLPSVAEFGVNLEPDVFKNNKLLICFFDYSQSPSRNSMLSLNEKTQSLLDKDTFLIFIQAETVNEQTLNNWLKQNEIVPPVGTSKIALPELGHRWGVQSLPWLILTDKNHIVTDEGFSLTELDKKIR